MGLPRFKRALAPLAFASSCAIALAAGGAARAADVVVPGATDFPESMSASPDGTLYFSSFGNGRVWRAKPGEAEASEWLERLGFGARRPGGRQVGHALCVLG
jgi:hypothetical protein